MQRKRLITMIERTFKDFDELFRKINQEIIENPTECVNYFKSDNYYIHPCLFHINDSKIDLEFSFLGYKEGKFKKLVCNYLDIEYWKEFKRKMPCSKFSKRKSHFVLFFKRDFQFSSVQFSCSVV